MSVSPGARSGANVSIVASTTPAGTIIQTLRGGSSSATSSSRVATPVMPSAATAATASGDTS